MGFKALRKEFSPMESYFIRANRAMYRQILWPQLVLKFSPDFRKTFL